MFGSLSGEIASRVSQASMGIIANDSLQERYPLYVAAARGMAFVELYALYEFTVRGAVHATLAAVAKSGVPVGKLPPSLLALILEGQWQSVSSSGRGHVFSRRIELLQEACGGQDLPQFDETLFPTDGSHYRQKQLYTVWAIFGIAQPVVPDARHLGRIEELVENRNAIAHGRRTPVDVGRRYSRADIEVRVQDTAAICNHIVDTLRDHVAAGGFSSR